MTTTYKVDFDDVKLASWEKDNTLLVRVNTDGLEPIEASALVMEVQEQMEKQFPTNRVIAHSHKIEFFVMLPDSVLPEGSKHIIVAGV